VVITVGVSIVSNVSDVVREVRIGGVSDRLDVVSMFSISLSFSCVCVYVCVCVCLCVCMYVCVFFLVHVYIYMYICKIIQVQLQSYPEDYRVALTTTTIALHCRSTVVP